MQIFTDHCVHTDVINALRKIGIKVERAIEANLDKSSDEEIFNYIIKTSQILLTFDKDFGNIIQFDIRKSAGAVIVYTERMSKEVIIKRIIEFFSKINSRVLKGTLFIIEADRIRTWPKPKL